MSDDPVTIIAERSAAMGVIRGHHHAACEILAALNDAGFHVVRSPAHDFAQASATLSEPTVEWRNWDGTEKYPTGLVRVIMRGGAISNIVDASSLRWNRLGTPKDIVKWRPA
jgi:hypothetical protein